MRTPSDYRHPVERFVISFFLILALTPFMLLGWALWRDNSLANGFEKIIDGATRLDVVRLMGKPTKTEKCGEFFGPIPRAEMEGCVTEYLYAAPVAQYYVVRFDKGGHVIGKDYLSSP
jgi:hypothetical protein